MTTEIGDHAFLWPAELSCSSVRPRRVLLIGTCRDQGLADLFSTIPDIGCPTEIELFYHTRTLPPAPPQPIEFYDLQVVFPALRLVLPEASYFSLDYRDEAAYENLLLDCKQRLAHYLDAMLFYNRQHGILTFVCNFLVPMQNSLGRMLPRYDLRNMQYFIETLNKALAELLSCYNNIFLIDFDSIVATFGRRRFQTDVVWSSNISGALVDFDYPNDLERIEAPSKMSDVYPTKVYDYYIFFWREILAMYRTVRQIDRVKLLIVDLDDTLWRGIAAERTGGFFDAMEGWPIGMLEALCSLKRRGVLLAIVSKNDRDRIETVWRSLVDDRRLSLKDFAMVQINWAPKAENIEEILTTLNLLPRNVVFIDDNPVERASVSAAFPEIRSFGANPYLWRRILLWSAETQVAVITQESSRRTSMVQGQVERDAQRRRLSRAEFLDSLGVTMVFRRIRKLDDTQFPRALELINKSNQFNTTGKRWTSQEFSVFFQKGGSILAFDVADKYTAYGSVGFILVADDTVKQFVMSCRVVGLEVEVAAMAHLMDQFEGRASAIIKASFEATDANGLCKDLYSRCGFAFSSAAKLWERSLHPRLSVPSHISISVSEQ